MSVPGYWGKAFPSDGPHRSVHLLCIHTLVGAHVPFLCVHINMRFAYMPVLCAHFCTIAVVHWGCAQVNTATVHFL